MSELEAFREKCAERRELYKYYYMLGVPVLLCLCVGVGWRIIDLNAPYAWAAFCALVCAFVILPTVYVAMMDHHVKRTQARLDTIEESDRDLAFVGEYASLVMERDHVALEAKARRLVKRTLMVCLFGGMCFVVAMACLLVIKHIQNPRWGVLGFALFMCSLLGMMIWSLWTSYVRDIGAASNQELIERQEAVLDFERREVAAKGDLSMATEHNSVGGELSIAWQSGQLTDSKTPKTPNKKTPKKKRKKKKKR